MDVAATRLTPFQLLCNAPFTPFKLLPNTEYTNMRELTVRGPVQYQVDGDTYKQIHYVYTEDVLALSKI